MKSWKHLLGIGVMGLAAITGAANAASLRVDIEALSATAVTAGQPVEVLFTLTNTSDKQVFVLDYQTPLSGRLEEGLFRVVRNGLEVPYEGVHALRVGPLAENWVAVAPGQAVSSVIDLAIDYPMNLEGDYVVYYDAALQIFSGSADRVPVTAVDANGAVDEKATRAALDSSLETLAVDAASTRVSVSGNAEPGRHPGREQDGIRAFYSCSSSLQSDLLNRQAAGRANALRAYYAASSYNTWYQNWFGNASSYVSTIRSRFANSYNRMGQTINYYCGSSAPYCSAGVVLYTYQSTTNNIYVCSAYSSQSSSFRAHAVNHETYHWYTVATADDVTYGYTNCRNLAASNPAQARNNADNYAYAADYAP